MTEPNRPISKSKIRKIIRYTSLLLNYPQDLWPWLEARARALDVSLRELLEREQVIDRAIDRQLASIDPEIAAQGGNTGKPGPSKIEWIFTMLK